MGTLIFTAKALKYTEKDATAIQKHCYQRQRNSRLDNFQVLGNAVNNFHLQLKESLLIPKMKPSFNVVKESIPLYHYTLLIMTELKKSELNNDLKTMIY